VKSRSDLGSAFFAQRFGFRIFRAAIWVPHFSRSDLGSASLTISAKNRQASCSYCRVVDFADLNGGL
jgi:hypothetical protein